MADHTSFVACSSARLIGDGDVLTIINALVNVASKWELLARCLKLSSSDIANISRKLNNGGDVNLALSEVISRWIAANPHRLTWSDLVAALRQPILNEEWCASQIEEKFCARKPTPRKLL